MSGIGTEASQFVEGTRVRLTRTIGNGAVKGAKGVVTLIHRKTSFSRRCVSCFSTSRWR